MLFDAPNYLAINEARWAALMQMRAAVAPSVGSISSIIDLGCGPGWFSDKLSNDGLEVVGYEGREDVLREARLRAPKAHFAVMDVDGIALDALPQAADAVLCFGLLYHLENPMRALRICRALSRKVLFLETMTIPEHGAVGRLIPENSNPTQGLRPAALVLSAPAIAHGLRLAGFNFVYLYNERIEHEDFFDTATRRKRRDVFVATDTPVRAACLSDFNPPALTKYPY
jgi:SAM-dependent methyltransferase